MTELFITNFNPRRTGVSSTIDTLFPVQSAQFDARLVGHPLPQASAPLTLRQARALSKTPPAGRPFAIWHLRRDPEMRAGIWARDVLGLPIKLVFTSAAKRRHSAIPRWLIGRMDAVIATTPEAAQFLDRPVAATVPHGVDTALFQPQQRAWADLGYGGKRGVVTIGRVRPEKGTDLFVEAMIPLLQADPDLVGLVVGLTKSADKAFANQLRAQSRVAGVEKQLVFTGALDHDTQLPAIMAAASAVAMLGRYEGYGVVPLEGLAAGTPFVASDTGAYREFSAQGKHGLIAPIGDAQAARAAIDTLLRDPARAAAMGQAGRDFVTASLSSTSEADGLAQVYHRLWDGEILR